MKKSGEGCGEEARKATCLKIVQGILFKLKGSKVLRLLSEKVILVSS